MKLTLDTYIISDTHFGHDNIIKFCNRPHNHEEIMIENWNNIVKDNDVILHLGDICYKGDRNKNMKILQNLKGQKYYIPGNHDRQTKTWYERAGFKVVGDLLFDYSIEVASFWPRFGIFLRQGPKRILLSHYPDIELKAKYWNINIHGHVHNNLLSIPLQATEQGRKYINISVEVMNYTPIKLGDILDGKY